MIAITKRNLMLYFHNKANVFFSLMGAWISFLLYIIFLQKDMLSEWATVSQPETMLDNWVMGGTLAVTSITTTWTAACRFVADRKNHKLDDFILSDTPFFKITIGYLLSASIIGAFMQIIMFSIMSIYFAWQDGLEIDFLKLPQLLLIMMISSILGASLGMILAQLVKSLEVAERLSIIIGTASGFLVGVYMPVGGLPAFAQHLIKVTPAAYVAATYRQLLMQDNFKEWVLNQQSSQSIKLYLGIGLQIHHHLTTYYEDLLLTGGIIILAFIILGMFQLVYRRRLR